MQHAEILARRAEGWVWLDDRVPVEEAYDEVGQAVDAGLQALEAEIEAGRLGRAAAAELAADARFELGSNEHHLGGRDSEAIDELSRFEQRLRETA
jgi:hypothetical protein